MTDDEASAYLNRNRLRLAEGLLGALSLILTVLVVFSWLDQLALNHQASPAHRSPLPLALAMSCAIGFTIGYLIPTWYREAPREEDVVVDSEAADRIRTLVAST